MTAKEILNILDANPDFPLFLNSAYRYLAASRLSLYRSDTDWAITIEIFGHSYTSGTPCTDTWTCGTRLTNRRTVASYVSPEAYQTYLKTHFHHEFESIDPIESGDWFGPEDNYEHITPTATQVQIGEFLLEVPAIESLTNLGIPVSSPPDIKIYELCRYIAAVVEPDAYFAPQKQRSHISKELTLLLQLKEWNHPDILNGEKPGNSETFQQLAQVLETGDTSHYCPTLAPNTHWSHWPEMKDL